MPKFVASLCLSFCLLCGLIGMGSAVTLEQIISRENPALDLPQAHLTVGRDGLVYLSNMDKTGMANPGYMLRMTRDGRGQVGGNPGAAVTSVAADAEGRIATANAHFIHAITLLDNEFRPQASVNEFDPGNRYYAPNHVEVGAGGDFYGLDQYKDRILRISPAGKLVKAYSYPREPAGPNGEVNDFRVDEATASFYFQSGRYAPVRKVGFDGVVQWSSPPTASGGFDVDEAGTLYTVAVNGDTVARFGSDGKPAGELKLQWGDLKPTLDKYQINTLRVWKGDLFLKRSHPTEMFLRFDRTTGALGAKVSSRSERLVVTYPSDTWTAAGAVPFTIDFENPPLAATPRWRVWARNAGVLNWREFAVQNGNLQVPADAAGIYQIKVSPEVFPWQRGAASEYLVQSWVEVRSPGSQGTANVFTPNNRTQYGHGEAIPFTVLLRGAKELGGKNLPLVVELLDEHEAKPRTVIASRLASVIGQGIAMTVPVSVVNALRPGNYSLRATSPGLTPVVQFVQIGPGLPRTSFHTVYYGDYTQALWPINANVWNASDLSIAQAERMRKMDINLMVERLNFNPAAAQLPSDNALRARLESDPVAVAPQKLVASHPLLQTLEAYGARGTQEMGILLGNDQGLPLGSDYGMPRADAAQTEAKKAAWTDTLTKATLAIKEYPAFRGWSWAANWWLTTPAEEPVTPEGRAAYKAAVERAYKTGKWDPLLDKVADVNLNFAPQATDFFNKTLRAIDPGAVTAVAAPYRNGQAYPPLAFKNVDEVDLQAQWEQIAPPVYAPHDVDYYKRPGKPAIGHPELWNDSGTGDQILPTLFQMTMRGANGVGFANELPNWAAEDSRSAQPGTVSIYRALNGLLTPLGPWLNTTRIDDRVAIVVSGRMIKLDGWKLNTFWGIFEAYISCLHAHHPAGIVFADDMTPESLKKYGAVLVVGQKVEMEPGLAAALTAAKAAGVAIFADGTCLPELVREFRPLGTSFDRVAVDHGMGVGGDESAYTRLPGYMRANLPALHKALDGIVAPAAVIANDEVWATVRQAEQGRYIFVVNNSTPQLRPEELWRVNLFSSVRVPVRTDVNIGAKAGAVYDILDLKRVIPKQGSVTADLRTLPMRVFAVLPTAIGKVALRGPSRVAAGQTLKWWAQVRDASDRPIAAAIPLRVRLLAVDGAVLDERFLSCGSKGIGGETVMPLNLASPAAVLQTTELFSGKTAQLKIGVGKEVPPTFQPAGARTIAPRPAVTVSGLAVPGSATAAARDFGPHLRDVALSGDGKTALINAMNWDENAYALDTTTGAVRWKKRIGQYFAFAPQSTLRGFAVQGFDFGTPEGYHLYLANGAGEVQRRFALYGVPPRAPFRMYASSFHDRINNFAVSADGGWVVSSGDLGVAAWEAGGKLLWSRDDWKLRDHSRANEKSDWFSTIPTAAGLLTLDANIVLLADGLKLSARNARTGAEVWQLLLSATGDIRQMHLAADGKTVGILGTAEGGLLYILRGGRLLQTLPAAEGYDFDLSPDGQSVALLAGNQLKLYSAEGGLRWLYSGDDRLRFARFSPDGKRIATSSDLGTLAVLSADGATLHEQDTKALAVPAWLPNGDLLLANWMGTVVRLGAGYRELWRTHLQPDVAGMRGHLLDKDRAPTARLTGWGNAEAKPWPITPNLLAQTKAVINFPNVERNLQNDLPMLTDGKPDAPANEWISPGEVNQWAGLRFFNTVRLDTKVPVRATAITFVEDAAHPSSWLRDADIEYWDAKAEKWVFLMNLLSNSAIHTHKFPHPVETSKLRIILPFALYGNLRLGELVLHGEVL